MRPKPLPVVDTESASSESQDRLVLGFYERYPCGGNATSDDHRWTRFPWLAHAFEPEAHEGELVLDLGCGIGIDGERFISGGADVVGIDFASKPLAAAAARFGRIAPPGRWHLVRGDVRALPFKAGTFDHVYSNGVLHHIPDYETAIRETRRCLKTRKTSTMLVYHQRSLMTLLTILTRTILGGRRGRFSDRLIRGNMRAASTRAGLAEVLNHPLIHYFTRSALKTELRKAGLLVAGIDAYDWKFPLMTKSDKANPTTLDRWFGRFLVARATKEPVSTRPSGIPKTTR